VPSFVHAEVPDARLQVMLPLGPQQAGKAFNGGFVPTDPEGQSRLRHTRGWVPADGFDAEATFDLELAGTYFYGGLTYIHFGHVMAEIVHRILTTRQHFRERPWIFMGNLDPAPICGFAALPATMQAALTFLGVAPESVLFLRRGARVERLQIAEPGSDLGGGPKPGYLSLLRVHAECRLNALHESGSPHRRVYVSKSNLSPAGSFLGERYLESQLAEDGYMVFHPEQHPLSWQMEVYRRSEVLIFGEGSACHGTELLGSNMLQTCVYLERQPKHREVFRRLLEPRSEVFQALHGAHALGTALGHPHTGDPLDHTGVWVFDVDALLPFLRERGLARLANFQKSAYLAAAQADLDAYLRIGPDSGYARYRKRKSKKSYPLGTRS